MKVILLSELRGKGGEGDVVDVAQGFAENYLFPNKIAILATKGNLKQLEERRHNIAKREEKRLADVRFEGFVNRETDVIADRDPFAPADIGHGDLAGPDAAPRRLFVQTVRNLGALLLP